MIVQADDPVREAGSPLGHVDVQQQLRRVEQRLTRDFAPFVSEEVVRRCVHDAVIALGQPRLHHFVPILVERGARRGILAWTVAQGIRVATGEPST